MENEKNFDKNGVYSKRVRAGKRRTYFFDVRTTRGNDYYLTITESKKRSDDESYERHKIFIYKEDFVKFVNAMQETVDYIKTDLLPDYDFDAHNHDYDEDNGNEEEQKRISRPSDTTSETTSESLSPSTDLTNKTATDDAEKWD